MVEVRAMHEQRRDSAYGLSVKLDLENGLIVYVWSLTLSLPILSTHISASSH